MGRQTNLILVHDRTLDDLAAALPDVYEAPATASALPYEEVATGALGPDSAAARIGEWLVLWDPVSQLAWGELGALFRDQLLGRTSAMIVRLDGMTDQHAFLWSVDGVAVAQATALRDEREVFIAVERLTGVTLAALEAATYVRIPFEHGAFHDEAGYRTSVLLVKGRTVDELRPVLAASYDFHDGGEPLAFEELIDDELDGVVGVARVDDWLVVWDPCEELAWQDGEAEARARIIGGATAFAGYLKDNQRWFGFRWYVDGKLRREVGVLDGKIVDDVGEPLPEEHGIDLATLDADHVLLIASRLTGLEGARLFDAQYLELAYRG